MDRECFHVAFPFQVIHSTLSCVGNGTPLSQVKEFGMQKLLPSPKVIILCMGDFLRFRLAMFT